MNPNQLTLAELKSERAFAEQAISCAVLPILQRFTEKTGLVPSSVDIPLVDCSSYTEKYIAIGPVELRVNL